MHEERAVNLQSQFSNGQGKTSSLSVLKKTGVIIATGVMLFAAGMVPQTANAAAQVVQSVAGGVTENQLVAKLIGDGTPFSNVSIGTTSKNSIGLFDNFTDLGVRSNGKNVQDGVVLSTGYVNDKTDTMANDAAKTTDGHIVFIDDDDRHIYDLHLDIRLVDTMDFPLSNYREFIGFVCGILSQDSDIKEIFVDGLTNIIRTLDSDSLVRLKAKLEKLSAKHGLDFIMTMNCEPAELPDEVRACAV